MLIGQLVENKVTVEDGEDLYSNGWYGRLEGTLELDLVEAAFLVERGRLEVHNEDGKIEFSELIIFLSTKDDKFTGRFAVYKDLRERGLPVRAGFQGSDFRVYERGAKPTKAEQIKWIVFVSSEDYPCEMDYLGKAIGLASNIRAVALWAVVDNDSDVTYYIISGAEP